MINKQFERKNVKPLREALGWTQMDLAVYLAVSIFAISSWENPKNYGKPIRIANAQRLCELADKYKIKF